MINVKDKQPVRPPRMTRTTSKESSVGYQQNDKRVFLSESLRNAFVVTSYLESLLLPVTTTSHSLSHCNCSHKSLRRLFID